MSDPLTIARAAWGDALPDWVKLLAEECARSSQNKVAVRLGRSAALVSAVLRHKYKGDMGAVEDVVRGRFMDATVLCPATGVISTAACRDWMAKAKTYSNETSERVRMHRACRACPRYRKEATDAA
ncbi:hypothetical protein [Tabrizicola fusiformis]|uniref:hypothetical protein n=1 Tax=Tabrizicola sp. SY72 TaxID=2741673 RepID=UPI0015730FB0|nr:hypothetical protein [Tabrizicola sp. SY72]NTT88527.1 hypothetical protein [Tabrizicola sp. SY72]